MEKIFPIQRHFGRVQRPAVEAVTEIPVPKEETYDAAENLFRQLDSIHAVFTNPDITSVRLVMNPESVVLKESLRTYTYLHLFGYGIDAVIVNRILPGEAAAGYLKRLSEAQAEHRRAIDESFSPTPILEAPTF